MKKIICILMFSIMIGSTFTVFAAEKEPRGLNFTTRTVEEWDNFNHIIDYLNNLIYNYQGNDERQQVVIDAFFDIVDLYYYGDDIEVTMPTCMWYLLNHGITYTESWK